MTIIVELLFKLIVGILYVIAEVLFELIIFKLPGFIFRKTKGLFTKE